MQTTPFTIDKDIPIPNLAPNMKYPFAEMGVGHSFCTDNKFAAQAAYNWATKHGGGVKFTTRAQDGGLRIWRSA